MVSVEHVGEVLKAFAKIFVNERLQERFVHEALKKPHKLVGRICHQLSSLFDGRFKNGAVQYEPDDKCIFFSLPGQFAETTWAEAMKEVNHRGGGGYLVVDSTGGKFYAQAEGFPPPETYAGSLPMASSSQGTKKER